MGCDFTTACSDFQYVSAINSNWCVFIFTERGEAWDGVHIRMGLFGLFYCLPSRGIHTSTGLRE